MTQNVSIDGRLLNTTGYRESSASQLSQYPKYNATSLKYEYKLLPFGRVKTYELDCYEQDVDWSNSNAKYLKDLMQAGTTVTLSVSYICDSNGQTIHTESATSCKVIGLAMSYQDIGKLNLRHFTVSLQEAP